MSPGRRRRRFDWRHPLADIFAQAAAPPAPAYRGGADYRVAVGQADVGHLVVDARLA